MTKHVLFRLGVLTFYFAVLCLEASEATERPLPVSKRVDEVHETKTTAPEKRLDAVHEGVEQNPPNSSLKTDSKAINPALKDVLNDKLPSISATVNDTPSKEDVSKTKNNSEPLHEANLSKSEGSSQANSKSTAHSPGAMLRGLYVFAGLSSVVMIYIAVKLIRLRKKRTMIRKYGLLANIDEVEMTPLGADEDDEDTTLFDAHQHSGH